MLRAYEGLFLVDETKASESFPEVVAHIRGLLERRGATIEKLEKWDTCRLTYEIDGKKRGTYLLSKFKAEPAAIVDLRHDCELSAIVMRAMILREENVGSALVEAPVPGHAPEQQAAAPAEPAAAPAEPAAPAAPAPALAAEPEGETDTDILGDTEELEDLPSDESR